MEEEVKITPECNECLEGCCEKEEEVAAVEEAVAEYNSEEVVN